MPPPPLCVGRLVFKLDAAQGLAKTRTNFVALCTGEKGMCKNAPNKKLHYADCPIHRIVTGFVAQGGDITRGDGSGGEVGDGFKSLIGDWPLMILFHDSRSTAGSSTMTKQD